MLSVSALLFEHGRRSPVLLPNISSVCVSATAGECEKSNRGYNNNLQSGGKLYIEMKKHSQLYWYGRVPGTGFAVLITINNFVHILLRGNSRPTQPNYVNLIELL